MADRALAQCPPPGIYYDQVAQVVMPRWGNGRVTLVGDACGAVSLLAGQGASLGIAGACLPADQLVAGVPVPTALARYERTWKPVVENKQRVARKSARWDLPESGGQVLARRLVLKLARLPRLPRLDRFFTTAFVGTTPHLPGQSVPAVHGSRRRHRRRTLR
ncbi:hypothetical protein [Streptomyces sp. NPDC053048]|uniref:hypothetical protein n=1 Tax=Streptomyces sp. NPDC053048 TaxID=3365694 RepID=UPI0037D8AB7E